MARRRPEVVGGDEHDEIISWYREELSKPAVFPWDPERPPVRIGPTWQTDDNGLWVLPERSIGWDGLAFCGSWLEHQGQPWRFTLEQARWLLWWYSLDETGTFTFRDGVLQRLKGWGKDPVGACLCMIEMLGPARFGGWANDQPVAIDVPDAWVQTAAVSLEQTKNTMRLFPSLISEAARKHFRIQIGKEIIHALGDTRMIQAVTSSPATLEGARSTCVLKNETQHWNASNAGLEMAAVIERNATKSPDGAARNVAITNAYDPSEDSAAQQDREAFDDAAAGESLTTGIMYDSLEAPNDAELTPEAAPAIVTMIRGDSIWLDPKRIVASILDTRNPPSRSRRFWYNQIWAREDAWIVPQDFDECGHPELGKGIDIEPRTEVALFFDGSKSDDATGLVAVRISDGHVITLGMWQKHREDPDGWTVPRIDVDHRVIEAFEKLKPVAFFADPSHAKDDDTEERYWDGLIDEWHRRYHAKLKFWAVPGKTGHSIMWDMTSPERVRDFTAAAERCQTDISEKTLTHDGNLRLRLHAMNARRYPNRYGVSVWKGHRQSKRKIDLAVCMIGARMVRRIVLNAPVKAKRSGAVW